MFCALGLEVDPAILLSVMREKLQCAF